MVSASPLDDLIYYEKHKELRIYSITMTGVGFMSTTAAILKQVIVTQIKGHLHVWFLLLHNPALTLRSKINFFCHTCLLQVN